VAQGVDLSSNPSTEAGDNKSQQDNWGKIVHRCGSTEYGLMMQEFQVLRVLEPALRKKAQTDSNSRGQKDFICREEKRKTA
jgi:hypothetical protein